MPIQPGGVQDTYANFADLVNEFDSKSHTLVEEGVANFAMWFKAYFKS